MSDLYNTIGKTYTATRAADPRITGRLVDLLALPTGSRILDVGAGTGNYSQSVAMVGYEVTAVEPSHVMRRQGKQHPRLQWHAVTAEELPFEDRSFDGLMMTLCLHHFSDWCQALREASRVVGDGPIVILTYNTEASIDFWLLDYFPNFREQDKQWFPTMEEIGTVCAQDLRRVLAVLPFPLPRDLQDHFAAAGWARPEIYLEESYRAGISSFAKASPHGVQLGLDRLEADLQSGEWEARHGSCRTAETLDVGYVFLAIRSDITL